MRSIPYPYIITMTALLCLGFGLMVKQLTSTLELTQTEINAPPPPDSLDYHLLMADMAWQRQLWAIASTHYLALAQATGNAEFGLLATSAALEAEALTQAHTSASLWAELDPHEAKAQGLAAMLSIMANNEMLAQRHLSQLLENAPTEALPHLLEITATLEFPVEQQLFLSLLEELSQHYMHQAPVWFAYARQAQSMHMYPIALAAADHSLALQPEWISAIALKVQILYQMQDKLAAKDYLADILAKQPNEDLQFIYTQISNELQ